MVERPPAGCSDGQEPGRHWHGPPARAATGDRTSTLREPDDGLRFLRPVPALVGDRAAARRRRSPGDGLRPLPPPCRGGWPRRARRPTPPDRRPRLYAALIPGARSPVRPSSVARTGARTGHRTRSPAPRATLDRRSPTIEARLRPAPGALPRPRLLACDIDGTILDDRGLLRPVVRDALASVAASGVDVVLATGRSPWSGIDDLAAALGLDGPQVTMQGALVSVPASGEVHRLRALPPAVYRDALWFAAELGLEPIVGFLDGHRAERLPADLAIFTPPLEARHVRYVDDLGRLLPERPIRLFLPTGPERHRAVHERTRAEFAGRASVISTDTTGVELLAPGTHKGEAIGWLAATRGFGLDAVAAVGDAPNDTEMLLAAGRSAAMGSAPPEVRAAADVVVPASSDDGVLDALAWFFPDLRPALRPGRSATVAPGGAMMARGRAAAP
jgi:hypothetical protein